MPTTKRERLVRRTGKASVTAFRYRAHLSRLSATTSWRIAGASAWTGSDGHKDNKQRRHGRMRLPAQERLIARHSWCRPAPSSAVCQPAVPVTTEPDPDEETR